jgi:uncharacterized protein YqfA (UPF0365 family)
VAQALAEQRRAEAVARQQEMKAEAAENRAVLVRAEAEVPQAMAHAFRAGRLHIRRQSPGRGSVEFCPK